MPEMCAPSILTYEPQKDAIFTNGTMEQQAVDLYSVWNFGIGVQIYEGTVLTDG